MRTSILAIVGALLMPPPGFGAELKISTWNLAWFTLRDANDARLPKDVVPRRREDIIRLQSYVRKLNADIIAFQEVDGSDAAAVLFDPSTYALVTISEAVTQRVGLAVRRPIRVLASQDYDALDVDAQATFPLRDGLDTKLELPGGKIIRLLVVHLKSGCQYEAFAESSRQACKLLSQQIAPLAAWAAAREAEGVPFAMLGDFNRILDNPEEMASALTHAAKLTRVTAGHENPCWGGTRFIDHIFFGGAAQTWLKPASLRVQVFKETAAIWRRRLSDHCPISATLSIPRDDEFKP